jgi:hypothetical protein
MNYLFMFKENIDLAVLLDFDMFCWELDEIVCLITSANDNNEGAEFPPNFIIVYADTDNEEHLNVINNKYMRLINESPWLESTDLTLSQGMQQ